MTAGPHFSDWMYQSLTASSDVRLNRHCSHQPAYRTAAVGGCLLVALVLVSGGCLRTSSRHDHQPTPSADPLVVAARNSIVAYSKGLSEISSLVAQEVRSGALTDHAAVFERFSKQSEISRKQAMNQFETALQQAVPASGRLEPERLAAAFDSLAIGFKSGGDATSATPGP